MSTVHDQFTIERRYSASPARVFDAWTDPAKKRRWFAEGPGFVIDAYRLDARVGGTEHCAFHPENGPPMTLDTYFHVLEPSSRIVSSYAMTMDGRPFSASLATLELHQDGAGTRLVYTEQAALFGEGDTIAGRRLGCEDLLERLAAELSST